MVELESHFIRKIIYKNVKIKVVIKLIIALIPDHLSFEICVFVSYPVDSFKKMNNI